MISSSELYNFKFSHVCRLRRFPYGLKQAPRHGLQIFGLLFLKVDFDKAVVLFLK